MTEASRAAVVWAAMRALFEGAAAEPDLLAKISGRKTETIARRAKSEKWHAPSKSRRAGGNLQARDDGGQGAGGELAAGDLTSDATAGLSRAERVARLAGLLIGEIETIQTEGQGSGYDKARIETVAALTRALDKLGELGVGEADMQQEQKKTDAEKASILRRIDERIVELARYFAAEILAGRADAQRGAES